MAAPRQKKKPAPKATTPRLVAKPSYKSFRLSKRLRHSSKPLPKARKMFSAAVRHLIEYKRLYAFISLMYLLLTLLLVKGLGFGFNSELTEVKTILDETFTDQSSFLTGAALFGVLLGGAGAAASEFSGIYQGILFTLVSLAVIWALRQTHAKQKPNVKDPFYKGMYPLIPFILVVFVILLQLLPLVIGNLLYTIVLTNGLAVTGVEQVVWAILFGLFALLSVYMISSSLFALYIVTLPDVTPLQALRSARELVRHRRLMIIRKLLFLPFVFLLLAILLMLPVILYATVIAEFVFFVLSIISVVVGHAYMYELYRKLL